jgi:hypothetical protein
VESPQCVPSPSHSLCPPPPSPPPSLRIEVDYYGAKTPLKQIASISAPEAALLVVQPYDVSAIGAIERAIMASDIGLTPGNDGKIIRMQVPQLTAVSGWLFDGLGRGGLVRGGRVGKGMGRGTCRGCVWSASLCLRYSAACHIWS